MAYNLPPSWDPGFALPKNVRDEGLERRAFVTRQMPRGTYDDVVTGAGGYAVPQYVMDERTGRGTFTTKELPGGVYIGPRVPQFLDRRPQVVAQARRGDAVRTTFAGLGGISGGESQLHPLFGTYGARAARLLMSQAMARPLPQRKAFLKGLLDKIDPTIWGRAEGYAQTYNRQGVPTAAAVEQGLARAMSEGIAKEIVDTGLRGAVKRRSLLGVGCFGCYGALGDVATKGDPTTKPPATCPTGSGNPVPGFTWSISGGTGHWARPTVGQVPVPNPVDACYTLTSTVHPVGSQQPRPGVSAAPASGTMMQVGPWQIPVDAENLVLGVTVRDSRTNKSVWALPSEWQQKIGEAIVSQYQNGWVSKAWGDPRTSNVADAINTFVPAADLGITAPPLTDPVPGGPSAADLATMHPSNYPLFPSGANAGVLLQGGWIPLLFFKNNLTPNQYGGGWTQTPLYRVKHPVNGADYGLYLAASPIEGGGQALYVGNEITGGPGQWATDPTLRLDSNPTGMFLHIGGPLQVQWRKIPPPERDLMAKIWGAIKELAATIIASVEAIVDTIGEFACDLLGNKFGTAAAVAAAVAAGAPPSAGATGVGIAHGVCSKPPPPPPQASGSSILPVALAAGGVVLAAFLFTRKKKAT